MRYRCRSCGYVFSAGAAKRNRWGDAVCPACVSPNIERETPRLREIIRTYVLFNAI
ncbi:hypothetical protein Tter_2401 [Thermobaculum terrenum ATCC BAA-798]|uniref:Uncharacterized protein n=1 Tax=Thermobaculum terrenum (strain ATCC BAA-798 / CCMEE 7001 / YNP1) TaxID=525904 RepID=D1CHS6_THET1|nr:hypothetical protein Tter_2401 [Thermobaculum terrenum ATCC BAA-798]